MCIRDRHCYHYHYHYYYQRPNYRAAEITEGSRYEAHYVIDPIKYRISFALEIGLAATKTFYECIYLHKYTHQQTSLNTRRKRIYWRLWDIVFIGRLKKRSAFSANALIKSTVQKRYLQLQKFLFRKSIRYVHEFCFFDLEDVLTQIALHLNLYFCGLLRKYLHYLGKNEKKCTFKI